MRAMGTNNALTVSKKILVKENKLVCPEHPSGNQINVHNGYESCTYQDYFKWKFLVPTKKETPLETIFASQRHLYTI